MSSDDTLKKFATSVKAKNLTDKFISEPIISIKAAAMAGVCDLVGYKKGKKEIFDILQGTHKVCRGVPLQTLERFWRKNINEFGNRKLRVAATGHNLSMITIDKLLSNISVILYTIHTRVVSGEY